MVIFGFQTSNPLKHRFLEGWIFLSEFFSFIPIPLINQIRVITQRLEGLKSGPKGIQGQ
jgi:hypothetical protein